MSGSTINGAGAAGRRQSLGDISNQPKEQRANSKGKGALSTAGKSLRKTRSARHKQKQNAQDRLKSMGPSKKALDRKERRRVNDALKRKAGVSISKFSTLQLKPLTLTNKPKQDNKTTKNSLKKEINQCIIDCVDIKTFKDTSSTQQDQTSALKNNVSALKKAAIKYFKDHPQTKSADKKEINSAIKTLEEHVNNMDILIKAHDAASEMKQKPAQASDPELS